MFWMFAAFAWGWVSRGANTCWVRGRTPPVGVVAIVDGTEVLKVCKIVGLLTVAVAPVAAVETTMCPPVWIVVLVESSLLRGDPDVLLTATAVGVRTVEGLPPLCEVLEGVCIGGLTSVTVGTLFAVCWVEITVFCVLVGQVRIIVLGVASDTAVLSLLTEIGPLLTCETAGCELWPLESTDPPPGIWQFTSTVLPFKVWTAVVPVLPTTDVASDTTVTTPVAVGNLDCVWAAVMLGPAADVVPAAPSMLEAWEPVLLMTPPCTSVPTVAETHENKGVSNNYPFRTSFGE